MNKILFFVMLLLIITSCSKDSDSPTGPEPEIVSDAYTLAPPNGKLPYPHHDPQFTEAQYDSMMSQLYLINNFGMWQGDANRTIQYFHDGIDIVSQNGTKIFAVKDGIVRAQIGVGDFYQTLYVEDKDKPGYAWEYTHVNNFQVQVGQEVKQGDLLAEIRFQGVEHIHFGRCRIVQGEPLDLYSTYECISPIEYFDYPDDEAPVIKTPFAFFCDQSDSLISKSINPTISGKVDIVVGMRDQGPHARGPQGSSYYNFGDRHCIGRIEYIITKDNADAETHKSFDFTKTAFVYRYESYNKKVDVVYKSLYLMESSPNNSKTFGYYIITNYKERDSIQEINEDDTKECWDTTEKKSDGSPKYPNGNYKITVKAYDFSGNLSQKEQTVTVQN